jgi:hypothetical protein
MPFAARARKKFACPKSARFRDPGRRGPQCLRHLHNDGAIPPPRSFRLSAREIFARAHGQGREAAMKTIKGNGRAETKPLRLQIETRTMCAH